MFTSLASCLKSDEWPSAEIGPGAAVGFCQGAIKATFDNALELLAPLPKLESPALALVLNALLRVLVPS